MALTACLGLPARRFLSATCSLALSLLFLLLLFSDPPAIASSSPVRASPAAHLRTSAVRRAHLWPFDPPSELFAFVPRLRYVLYTCCAREGAGRVVEAEDIPVHPAQVCAATPLSSSAKSPWPVLIQLSLIRFAGVADIASVRFSLPAHLLEPTPNLGRSDWSTPRPRRGQLIDMCWTTPEYWNYLDRPEAFARSADSRSPHKGSFLTWESQHWQVG